jgi:hypothetical protein
VAKYVMIVQSDSKAGRDDEFNEWYNDRHIDEVLSLEGFVGARRYALADLDPPQEGAQRYICIYEIETDDIEATRKALGVAARDGTLFLTDSISDPSSKYYEPISELRTAG